MSWIEHLLEMVPEGFSAELKIELELELETETVSEALRLEPEVVYLKLDSRSTWLRTSYLVVVCYRTPREIWSTVRAYGRKTTIQDLSWAT